MNTDMYENKKMDQHMRAQELAEESFDDIEIDGYLDYEEETASEEDDHDIEYVEDIDIDDTVNEETVAADKDWVNNGLNKKQIPTTKITNKVITPITIFLFRTVILKLMEAII